jgi:hypothetical protein
MDALEKKRKKQEKIENKIIAYSWGGETAEQIKFFHTIHDFFSPGIIPDGLSREQARLIYLIANSVDFTAKDASLTQYFTGPNGKVTKKSFAYGIRKFQEVFLNLFTKGINKNDGQIIRIILL